MTSVTSLTTSRGFDDAVAHYLEHLTHVKRASPHTVRSYTGDLAQVRTFLVDKSHPALGDLARLDLFALRGFLAWRHKDDATTSVLRKLSALRSFLLWCKREGRITTSPAALLESPKRPKAVPRSVSVDEAFALCTAPDDSAAKRAAVEPARCHGRCRHGWRRR